MSTDKSLKSKSALRRHRNVLDRSERVAMLKDDGRWKEGDSVFGLPKVRTVRARRRVKAKPAPKPEAAAAVAPGADAPAAEKPKEKKAAEE